MTSKNRKYPHPYIPELVENLRQKKIDRREFLRTSTLLGLSATAAYGIAGQITGQPFMRSASAAAGKGGFMAPRGIPCPTCGKLFFKASLPIHQKQCAVRMGAQLEPCPSRWAARGRTRRREKRRVCVTCETSANSSSVARENC